MVIPLLYRKKGGLCGQTTSDSQCEGLFHLFSHIFDMSQAVPFFRFLANPPDCRVENITEALWGSKVSETQSANETRSTSRIGRTVLCRAASYVRLRGWYLPAAQLGRRVRKCGNSGCNCGE